MDIVSGAEDIPDGYRVSGAESIPDGYPERSREHFCWMDIVRGAERTFSAEQRTFVLDGYREGREHS